MKKVSDRVARNRLLALADFLEGLDDNLFNFETWGDVTNVENVEDGQNILKDPNLCGTTACALGWAPNLPFARRLGFELRASKLDADPNWVTAGFYKNGRVVQPDAVGKQLFGLTSYQCDILFHPGNSPFRDGPEVESNAADVAANIRRFVAVRFGKYQDQEL